MATAGQGVGVTERVEAVTIANWMTVLTNVVMRYFPLLARLQKLGRVKRLSSEGGGQIRWPVQKALHALEQESIGVSTPFAPLDNVTNAFLRWGGYMVRDAIHLQERAENKGDQAIIKLFNSKAKMMQDSAKQRLAGQFFVDGNATGNGRRWHGLESFMSISTQTNTDEFATTLNDTYANLSTSYTSFNAAAAATDPDYGAWSPVIVSTNRTVGGVATSWASYAIEFIRAMLANGIYGGDDEMDLVILTKTAWKALANLLDDKERVVLNMELASREYGFNLKRAIPIDGSYVIWDDSVPATDVNSDVVQGYGLNTSRMALKMLSTGEGIVQGDSLFEFFEAFDIKSRMSDMMLLHYGNLHFDSPKYFGKLADIA
jgi:hypothetical protein